MTEQDNDRKISRLESEVQRLQSAIAELTVLNDLAIAASSSLEVGQMLDTIVEKSIRAVKAEQGSIMLLTEQDETPLKTLIRQEDRRSRISMYKVGANLTGWVLKYRKPLKVDDLATDERFNTTPEEQKELKSLLCVPIQFRAEMLGILMVTNKKTFEPFSDNDMRLLSIIAAQSGQLIRNTQLQEEALQKRRMQQELDMARTIQRGLLPTTSPSLPGVDVASYFNAADEVSGDYYDYFPIDEHRLGVVMADVSGHGASSALMMTMVKGILHAIAQDFQSLDSVLAELNKLLADLMPKEMFVTLHFMLIDADSGVVRFSNAGHNPLVHYQAASGSVELVQLRGPALGLTSISAYQEKSLTLAAGDALVLYTDGVTEAFNEAKEMFEEERLIEAVREVATGTANEIVNNIQARLAEFTEGLPQSDDVAIIAIKSG